MEEDLVNLLKLSGAFLLLFAAAELLYRFAKVKAEYTRKLVHAGTGVLTLLFPLMLVSHWSVLLICSSFLVILLASWKWDILPSINAIDRFSLGSLLYPVTVYVLFFFYTEKELSGGNELIPQYVKTDAYIWFYLPILVLAFADPAAALVGKNFPVGRYRINGSNKTLMGSLSFAVVAFALSYFMIGQQVGFWTQPRLLVAMLIAVVSGITEAVSSNGVDNITVPLAVLIVMNSTLYTVDQSF